MALTEMGRSIVGAPRRINSVFTDYAACTLMREVVRDPLTIAILLVTVVLLVMRKLDSLWIILGASALELAAASTHLLSGL